MLGQIRLTPALPILGFNFCRLEFLFSMKPTKFSKVFEFTSQRAVRTMPRVRIRSNGVEG